MLKFDKATYLSFLLSLFYLEFVILLCTFMVILFSRYNDGF